VTIFELLFMALTNDRLRYLLNRYADQVSTEKEENELFDLLTITADLELESLLFDILEHTEPQLDELRKEKLLSEILRQLPPSDQGMRENRIDPSKVRKISPWRIAVAASIVLTLGIGSYFLLLKKTTKHLDIVKTELPKDVAPPKGTKAMITLANGQSVALDSITSGTLVTQGTVSVIKTGEGEIVYQGSSSEVAYNILYNPRGSTVVSLVLNDGTKVWLNSESSLRYPTSFTGNERSVEITGEAYFEVAKDARKKFIVRGRGAISEVLGTHFNVNTYTDESSVNVTLLEGSVKVKPVVNGSHAVVIRPGQQAQVKESGEMSVMKDVDLEEVMAWKNGKFQFGEAADISTIMKQVARWYDLHVEYNGVVQGHIGGTISRDVNVSQVFRMLEMTGVVKFQIDGKKVVVMPKMK
jgi:ferric-dicitrate binding protein FerR (iron transport regulator)